MQYNSENNSSSSQHNSHNTTDNNYNENVSSKYTSSNFAGGVPMNEPMAERYCSPASDAYSEGIVAGCLTIRVSLRRGLQPTDLWSIESWR